MIQWGFQGALQAPWNPLLDSYLCEQLQSWDAFDYTL